MYSHVVRVGTSKEFYARGQECNPCY